MIQGAGANIAVNVGTDGARAFPGEVSYGASKLALEGYSRAAALEFARFGITVNVVSLAAVQTGWIDAELADQIVPRFPSAASAHRQRLPTSSSSSPPRRRAGSPVRCSTSAVVT